MFKNTLALPGAAPFFRRWSVLGTRLLAALLLMTAAAPSWAIPIDSHPLPRKNVSLQEDYAGVIREAGPFLHSPASSELAQEYRTGIIRGIDAVPDAEGFPILLAGPASAVATTTLASKSPQASSPGAIAVIYPDIGEPYRSIFAKIIEGIEDKARGRVSHYAVGANADAGELNNSLRHQDTKAVIALGRQGMKLAAALDRNIGVVVGGVLTATENEARNLQVNSMSPDPALLFSRLKGMMPKVRRVFTVYDPRQNAWMMRLAQEAARAQGLEFTAYEAQDLRSAMRAYQEILATANNSRDALWLPQDSTTVEDSAVLPLVLQESWTRHLAVFSSSFGHVKRGILFALYPDNVELGRSLASSALDLLASGENKVSGMAPLREVLMAINLRTAKHLGTNTSDPQNFDTVFPEP